MTGRRFWELVSVLMIWSIAVVTTAAFTDATDQGSRAERDQAALSQIQQALAKAWVEGDRATVERIIAPEWRSTGPDGRGSDRARVLAEVFEQRVHKIRRLDVDDVRVQVFGDAAVVTGRTHGVGEFAGAPYDVAIRFTDTFVRRKGRWYAVASHASLDSQR
jgi:ketosteroid isomerase-like protein